MVSQSPLQILRSNSPGVRPTGAPVGRPAYIQGEPYVNYADRQFGVLDPSAVPFDLIGVTFFSASASYPAGTLVVYQGLPYVALVAVTPGAFNPAQWLQATPFSNPGGFMNRLMNGCFDIWQRGTSISVPGAAGYVYTADQWVLETDQTITVTIGTGTGVGRSLNALQIGAVAGLSECFLIQFIEGNSAAVMAGRQATFQIRVRNYGSTPITPRFSTTFAAPVNDFTNLTIDFPWTDLQTIQAGQTVTLAITFPVSPNAINGYTIAVNFFTGNVAVTDADLRTTPGLPTGLNASPPFPELRPIAVELPICQRYYEFGRTYTSAYSAAVAIPIPQTFFTVFKYRIPIVRIIDMTEVDNCSNLRDPVVAQNGFTAFIDVTLLGNYGLVFDWTASADLATGATMSHRELARASP